MPRRSIECSQDHPVPHFNIPSIFRDTNHAGLLRPLRAVIIQYKFNIIVDY